MTSLHSYNDWWASLKHGGVLITPSKLTHDIFAPSTPVTDYEAIKLRRAVNRFEGDASQLSQLMDHLLFELAGLPREDWLSQSDLGTEYTEEVLGGDRLKPRRLWLGSNSEELPVFVAEQKPGKLEPRLGVGKGKRITSRVQEWLRRRRQPLGLVTNGYQWRLIYAASDYEAWCEWDLSFWFVEGEPGPQVDAWRRLMSLTVWQKPSADQRGALLSAILDSRKGQAELSSVLGERVRQAVELLITASQATIETHRNRGVVFDNRALYLAATRVVMRCIILLFAESRLLLPTDNRLYQSSYSLEGLRQQLDRRAGGRAKERLDQARAAWPRLVALFRLVFHGSSHEALTVPQYNGGLFEAGSMDSADPVLRSMAVIERADNTINDAHIHKLLRLITRTRIKVRQGRTSAWVEAPVDFSDLSSEYIGILYEGLLDFELKRAVADEAMLFLAIGNEPVLPLSRLEAMDDKAIANLFKELKKKDSDDGVEEDPVEETDKESEDEVAEEQAAESDDDEATDDEATDESHAALLNRANEWLLRAVDIAKLARKPRGKSQLAQQEYQDNRQRAARQLIGRLVEPGEFYLVRWGGTRKGSGTFYTRPQLAAPTVRRTLQPLAYSAVRKEVDERTGLEEVVEWAPKTPEQILNLKICDPAMGSGSFLASALRYLTEALHQSLYFHDRLERKDDGAIARLADGLPIDHPSQQTLPLPLDHEAFDEQLRARLKRHIVERCIYGVDFDSLAVELGRMSLWVETMDRDLPFGFLDHKLKVGNSLVGAWLDNFRHYPVMAWLREGGDKDYQKGKPGNLINHWYEDVNGERKGDCFTQAIKGRKDAVKEQLIAMIYGQREMGDSTDIDSLHSQLEKVLERLHELPVHETEKRAEVYQNDVLNNPAYATLKDRLDLWCALWYWPGEKIDVAPLPQTFQNPSPDSLAIARQVSLEQRFFHWELEFPDVFTPQRRGFDAVLGNPPWETMQPQSKEFFLNVDPFYRAYGKQEALLKQLEYFRSEPKVEQEWIHYSYGFKALGNWLKYAGTSFGDRISEDSQGKKTHDFPLSTRGANSFTVSESLHAKWRVQRHKAIGYAEKRHPFLHQGKGKAYLQKMFMELAPAILDTNGRFGVIVPSGIYSDYGTDALRSLFISNCDWEWLFGFENREGVFDIHRSFKFCVIVVQKGKQTQSIRTAFMHRDVNDWERAEDFILAYPKERIEQFSPDSKGILEISSDKDLLVLKKIYENGVLLGDQSAAGWGVKFRQGDFNMTSDSKLFPGREKWEAKGYLPDEYGHWLKGPWRSYDGPRSALSRKLGQVLSRDGKQALDIVEIADVALPVYNAKMFSIWDFSSSSWVSGKGRGAVWDEVSMPKIIGPEYIMSHNDFIVNSKNGDSFDVRLVFKDISTAVHQRTMMSSIIPPFPAVNACPLLFPSVKNEIGQLQSNLASFAFDYAAKFKIGYLHLNYFIVAELPLILYEARKEIGNELERISTSLSFPHIVFSNVWIKSKKSFEGRPWRKCWALSAHERLRLKVMSDCLIASAYKLDFEDLTWVLRETAHPVTALRDRGFCAALDQKAFWRVDKILDPELRQPVLTLIAYSDLLAKGLGGFLAQNGGEGWMIPETLRLADYGLGHDDRAMEAQPVAGRLGPRFFDWQLEQGIEESWEECRRHADLIRQIVPKPEEKEELGLEEPVGQYQASLDL